MFYHAIVAGPVADGTEMALRTRRQRSGSVREALWRWVVRHLTRRGVVESETWRTLREQRLVDYGYNRIESYFDYIPLLAEKEEEFECEAQERCCFDLEPYRAGDSMVRLPCLHVHHANCVLPYLRSLAAPQCPICRTRVEPDVIDRLPLFEWRPPK